MKNDAILPLAKSKIPNVNNTRKQLIKSAPYLILLLPPIVYYIVFHYFPMYGLLMAFKDYRFSKGIMGSPWADYYGFEHFIRFFKNPDFWILIRNTAILSIQGIVFGFPMPVVFAILINECRLKYYKKCIQTISYLPHFISVVALIGIMTVILSPQSGTVNGILQSFGIEPIYFMASVGWFRPLYVISGIWQDLGWNAIIYIAAITTINSELYESAYIDGAGRLKRIWYITIPGIIPTMVILLIFRLGDILGIGFEKVWLMQNGINMGVSDVISTYVYRVGIIEGNFAFSTAVGLFNTVINFLLIIAVNMISKKMTNIYLW